MTSTKNTNFECKVKCMVCPGWCYSKVNVRTCHWCDCTVHKKCHRDSLGCIKCCESNIPGYYTDNCEIIGKTNYIKAASLKFNPYDTAHIINSIGNSTEQDENNELTNDLYTKTSLLLTNCKYQEPSNVTPSKAEELKILSLNIRSLTKNIEVIREEIDTYLKFDVLCFNETNCNVEKLVNGSNDLLIDGFHEPFLKAPVRKSGKGGGLAIYVNKKVCNASNLELVDPGLDPEDTSGEFQILKMHNCKHENKTKVIVNFYRSPSKDVNRFLNLLDTALYKLDRHSRKHVLFFGDANIDLIKYDTDNNGQCLIDTLAKHGYVQSVSKPTRVTSHSATLIDHVYTNSIEDTISSNVLTIDLTDHLGTLTTIRLATPSNKNGSSKIMGRERISLGSDKSRIINEANNVKFKELLECETWEGVLGHGNACTQYESFLEKYTSHYNTAYPLRCNHTRRAHERASPKPWILPWLESACERKQKAYYTKIKKPTEENVASYNRLKKFCEKHVEKAKNQYFKKQFEKYSDSSKKQWRLINGLLNRSKKGDDRIRLKGADGKIVDNDQAVAERFNDYFSSIATKIKAQISSRQTFDPGGFEQYLHKSTSQSIYLKPTDPTEIQKIVLALKNKSTLDTKIEPLKVATSSQTFLDVLATVINASFTEGIFPKSMKVAKVTPIFKGGSKIDVSNYRPISLLSSFSKIYEKLMHKRVLDFLDKNESLFEHQYGFRPGRSCEHALLNAQSSILHNLGKKKIALLLLLDYSKAFDVIDHQTLLKKLEHYGIRGTALKWFKSYLSDRVQYVSLNGASSTMRPILHGVPQGSILGPLLFVIYINDLPGISKISQFILYADDANIIITGSNLQEIFEKTNVLTKALINWVHANGLSLNVKKTCYMIFSRRRLDPSQINQNVQIDGTVIERKAETRFLGVIVDEKLSWASHIKAIKMKMSRFIGILHKIKHKIPIKARVQVYHSFVQSHLNFCSLIWGFAAKTHIESLFVKQKQGIRALQSGYVNHRYVDGKVPDHTKKMFEDLEILTVHSIIVRNALILMHKIKNMNSLIPKTVVSLFPTNIPKWGSAFDENIEWLSTYSQSYLKSSLFYKGPILAISEENLKITCPQSIFSLNTFKKSSKRIMLELQCSGNTEEWPPFLLHNIQGLRKSNRAHKEQITSVKYTIPS